MITKHTKAELSKAINAWKSEGHKIALVPTMGALHEGHLSLMEIAKKNARKIVVSIFVNPTQFAPHEDFARYPRNEKSDLEKLKRVGVDLVYLPNTKEIYPHGPVSDVKAGSAAQGLEGDIRPGHFDGVISVVSRLLGHVKPDIAVFGEKDYQQLCVIKEFVKGKNLPIEIIPGPIVRDEEGLALSSRNAYLSSEELKIAQTLNKVLFELVSPSPQRGEGWGGGERGLKQGWQKLLDAGFNEVQYLEFREADTLASIPPILTLPPLGGGKMRLLAAVRIGKIRLIDNIDI